MQQMSENIQQEIDKTQASLENAKQQLKQFEEDERIATTKEAAIHAKRNQSDTEVGINFDKNKIKNLRKDLITAKEREEELAHKKSLKDAEDRVARRLKEVSKLDQEYTKYAEKIAKVLNKRAKLYEDIKPDANLLCENDQEVNLPEHKTRGTYSVSNNIDPYSKNRSYIEHISYNCPVQFNAVLPSINGENAIYESSVKHRGLYLGISASAYKSADILNVYLGEAYHRSSKI